jgi:hypothetical protein
VAVIKVEFGVFCEINDRSTIISASRLIIGIYSLILVSVSRPFEEAAYVLVIMMIVKPIREIRRSFSSKVTDNEGSDYSHLSSGAYSVVKFFQICRDLNL